MRIEIYTYIRNEEALLPYFLRHYSPLGPVTIFDNESTDRTSEIARAAGARVIPVDTGGRHEVSVLQWYMNEAYKGSRGRADWVILAEGDEFYWHYDFLGLLEDYRKSGVTLPRIQGYDMVSERPPSGAGQVYSELKYGFANPRYSKRGVLKPEIDINFGPGGHDCAPSGPVKESLAPEIRLLHYRFMGEDHFVRRYGEHRRRMSRESLEKKWDVECMEDQRERYRKELAGKEIVRVVP